MQPLSPAGRAWCDRLALEAASRGVKPQAVWHSGKLRARQTAEAFWRACNPLADFTAVRGLQPGDPAAWIADRLLAEEKSVMIAGHMPFLPRLLQRLVTGDEAGTIASEFPLHGIVCLERIDDRWRELWRLSSPA
jgi:phosphohistidine phosphatase